MSWSTVSQQWCSDGAPKSHRVPEPPILHFNHCIHREVVIQYALLTSTTVGSKRPEEDRDKKSLWKSTWKSTNVLWIRNCSAYTEPKTSHVLTAHSRQSTDTVAYAGASGSPTSRPSQKNWTELHKTGMAVGVHDVINHSKFGFNIFTGFRSTGGQNFRFPIDFAGHRYNSAAATAQPVTTHKKFDPITWWLEEQSCQISSQFYLEWWSLRPF